MKHGAYQSIYADMLNTEEQILFYMIQPTVNIDDEIKILRLKITRLLHNTEKFLFYNEISEVERIVLEQERINGINACTKLRRAIELKAKMATDTEKLELKKSLSSRSINLILSCRLRREN